MITPELLHYIAAGTSISLGAIGAGIGQGIAGMGAEDAMTRQLTGNMEIFRSLVIGLALIESGAIVALVTTLLILLGSFEVVTFEIAFAELGIGLAVGVAAASISIASSFVVKASAHAISRQPYFTPKILTLMLITQSIIEAPAIFAFIIALVMHTHLVADLTYLTSIKLFSSGLIIALGCIGPSIGQAIFANAACTAVGTNKDAYSKLFPYALINEAIIETPMIFCVLISLVMMYAPPASTQPFLQAIKFLVASCTLGIGSFGSSIGIGYVASKSCHAIALDPNLYEKILRTTLLAIAFIESCMIYAFIIAMLMIV